MNFLKPLWIVLVLTVVFTLVSSATIKKERKQIPSKINTTIPPKDIDKAKVLQAPKIYNPCSDPNQRLDDKGVCRRTL